MNTINSFQIIDVIVGAITSIALVIIAIKANKIAKVSDNTQKEIQLTF